MALSDYDFKKIGLFLSVLLILLGGVIGAVSGFYYFNKFRLVEKSLRETSVVTKDDVRALVAKVGKLIKLPADELPTVATVTDLSRLTNQPFFAKAKVGDKVLLYTQNKKAFLYDPLNNQIIEVGPLILPSVSPAISPATGSEVAGLQVTPGSASLTNIALLNSTGNPDIVSQIESQLAGLEGIRIVDKSNSQKKNYSKSIIIDLTGNNAEKIKGLADSLGLTVSALPNEEEAPDNADLLIILGSDRL